MTPWTPPLKRDGTPCDGCTPKVYCRFHKRLEPESLAGTRMSKSIFTPDRKEKFLELKKMGATDKRACMAVGWSVSTYQLWKRNVERDEPTAFPALHKFFEEDIPAAENVLYLKCLAAIERGVANEDADKAAKIGLSTIDKLYGKDTEPAAQRHEGSEPGSPIEFKIVVDDGKPKDDTSEE